MFFNINLDSLASFKSLIKAKFNWKSSKKIRSSAIASNKGATAINGNVNIYNQYFSMAKDEFSDLNRGIIPQHGIEKNRYARLEFDFATKSIDMENEIKNIFKFCNKICLEQLSDNKKYRVLHNLNDIISRLSYSDIQEYKKLYSLLQGEQYKIDMHFVGITNGYGQHNPNLTMFKNCGLIDMIVDYHASNRKFDEVIKEVDRKIDTQTSHRFTSSLNNGWPNNMLQAYLVFTKEGKILINIIKALEAKSDDLSKTDLENIYAILNA